MKLNEQKLILAMANSRLNAYGLCAAAGIQYQTYRRIIKGGTCKPATVGSIAKALGVPVEDLLDGTKSSHMREKNSIEKTKKGTKKVMLIVTEGQGSKGAMEAALNEFYSGDSYEILYTPTQEKNEPPLEFLGRCLQVLSMADCVIYGNVCEGDRLCLCLNFCAAMFGKESRFI